MSHALPSPASPRQPRSLPPSPRGASVANAGIAGKDVLTFAVLIPNLERVATDPPSGQTLPPSTLRRHGANPLTFPFEAALIPDSDPACIAAGLIAPPAGQAHPGRGERDTRLAGLLADVAEGRTTAFEGFYDATIGFARALARRMVPASELDDLLADAYFQAWRDAPRFDALRGSSVTWLLTIVRSRALDLLRRQRASHAVADTGDGTETTVDVPSGLPGPEELLSGTEAGTWLHAALLRLSSNERWVLGLAYYADLSHREICERTGLPLGTVKSLILRAQSKLREHLAPC